MVSVFLYHLTGRLTGGFVGVDVFFVISGFLITTILVAELETDSFSLSAFYERRIRRIAPALFAVFLFTTVAAYIYLLPSELVDYAKSLLAAMLSGSNFFFWSQAGYFDAPSSAKPLLHTWSLAVEEQFYLAFPLLLAAIYRFFPRKLLAILVALALASLILNIVVTPGSANYAFFWPFTRAWELLFGSIISITEISFFRKQISRNLGSALGLLMVLFAVFRYTQFTSFPGVAAILPVLGATLIIAAGTQGTTLVGRVLSWKPFVFTGLISYSLYLWHWPLIVFAQHGLPLTGGASPMTGKLIMLVEGYAIAVLSWRFIERPFRKAAKDTPRRNVFLAAGSIALITIAASITVLGMHGFPSRFNEHARQIASYMDQVKQANHDRYREGACFLTTRNVPSDFQRNTCLAADPARPSYLILGDSLAAQLYGALSKTFPEVNILQATAAGCKPTLDQGRDRQPVCVSLMTSMLHDYLPAHRGVHVLLASRWNKEDLPRLGDTITYLQSIGVDPIVIGPIMEYDAPLPRLLAMSIKDNDPAFAAKHRDESQRQLDGEMARLAAARGGARYISYYKDFCTAADCLEFAGEDVPLQGDQAHLTEEGAMLVAHAWREKKELP